MQHGWSVRFGLLSLAMAKAYGVEGKVYAGIVAILPEKLAAASANRKRYADFSLQPAALRDLALVVPVATTAAEVQKQLAKSARSAVGGGFGLEAVTVFDVYQGKGLPEGTKSLAFSLVFRAPDRTLTDEEVNAVFTKIQEDVVKSSGYVIRK
jgi:phenylalanyl-tRNA synthetase beta chain